MIVVSDTKPALNPGNADKTGASGIVYGDWLQIDDSPLMKPGQKLFRSFFFWVFQHFFRISLL